MSITALTVPLGRLPAEERGAVLDSAIEAFHVKTLEQIAGDLKVTPATLTRHLMKDRQEQWKAVQFAKALIEEERARAALSTADDMLKVNKAEKMLKAAQWHLERLDRRLYGSNPPDEGPNSNFSITLNIGIDRSKDPLYAEKEVKGEVLNGGQSKD
jgi:hypothetical protein